MCEWCFSAVPLCIRHRAERSGLVVTPWRTRWRGDAASLRRSSTANLRTTRLSVTGLHGPSCASLALSVFELCTLLRGQHGAHLFAGFHRSDELRIASGTGLVETGAQRHRITAGTCVDHVGTQSESVRRRNTRRLCSLRIRELRELLHLRIGETKSLTLAKQRSGR
jgi:hypothetical protein